MKQQTIKECINIAVDKKACEIINKYIDYWSCENKSNIQHLDAKYYYLIYAHKHELLDIFNYDQNIFTLLFLIL